MSIERRYRRLLLAYPGPYRRGHGAEIVTTLLEMAGDEQTRPTRADSWHLVLSGARQRFRLPSGRPLAWLAAVLITVIGGAFGAAAGSWAAERTFADLPGDARLEALTRQVAGGGVEFGSDRSASPWWTTMASATTDQPGWTPEAAQQRLAADGWQTGAIAPRTGKSFAWDPDTGAVAEVPLHGSEFEATRDGLRLEVSGYVGNGHGTVSVNVWPAGTGAMIPAALAGALLGLVGGWLVAAAGAYRVRALTVPRRRLASALAAAGLATLALPAFAFWVNVWRVLASSDDVAWTVHSALNAGPYWSYGTPWMLLQLTVAGAVLAVAAWALLLTRPTAGPVPVPA
ncbi:hypothetical protein [Paractinoplanes brasiliensis]|uniref:Uncharacterized protein n=1 Tax=Paractinoplanes brasiliensis TaxID=52695 RepID=A0A4R6J9S6_9ACTN|nr:hypothetical protein [Actinoplanes brasiliensis]TDO31651.1 hypothetical protein C8E87_7077 [Actinoplanes brasiliensis]GID30757.1 hypothetical protein Abr02nite_57400 [Actinoplanes brasiliensis]